MQNAAIRIARLVQGYQQSMNELDAKLNRIADLADELKELKTKHEMTAAQNANMFVKLQVNLPIARPA